MTFYADESDEVSAEDADFTEIFETFDRCTIGDTVSLVSHLPAGGGHEAEYFAYSGEVVEDNVVNMMPGIVIESPDPDLPKQARLVHPMSEDRSLTARFVQADGPNIVGGRVTSLTIESESHEEDSP